MPSAVRHNLRTCHKHFIRNPVTVAVRHCTANAAKKSGLQCLSQMLGAILGNMPAHPKNRGTSWLNASSRSVVCGRLGPAGDMRSAVL